MKRNDMILIVSLLCVSLALVFVLRGFRRQGDTVVITVDDQMWGEYSLNENREIPIRTEQGYNLVVIQNGAVCVRDADCRDHICMAHKELTAVGDAIVCLPHGMVVEVRGET